MQQLMAIQEQMNQLMADFWREEGVVYRMIVVLGGYIEENSIERLEINYLLLWGWILNTLELQQFGNLITLEKKSFVLVWQSKISCGLNLQGV